MYIVSLRHEKCLFLDDQSQERLQIGPVFQIYRSGIWEPKWSEGPSEMEMPVTLIMLGVLCAHCDHQGLLAPVQPRVGAQDAGSVKGKGSEYLCSIVD